MSAPSLCLPSWAREHCRVQHTGTKRVGHITGPQTATEVCVAWDGETTCDHLVPVADLTPVTLAADMLREREHKIRGEVLIGLAARLSDELWQCEGTAVEQMAAVAALLRAVRDREQTALDQAAAFHPAQYDGPLECADRDVTAMAALVLHGPHVRFCADCQLGAADVGSMRLATGMVDGLPLCGRCAAKAAHPAGRAS